MSFRKLYGFALIVVLFVTSLYVSQVRSGEKEEIAKKLIKFFLATAILSPPGVGASIEKVIIQIRKKLNNKIFFHNKGILPLPLPIPMIHKPPLINPPHGFHPGIPFL